MPKGNRNVQGWRQFITAKEEMLDFFDRSRTLSKRHKVQTFHGNVAEALFRKWLSNFLPKKYAVTSGYIVSTLNSEDDELPHYDVIIYNQLESPILWIENNPDNTEQGKSLGIPAEYVQGVIEVKSSFENKTVKEAISHLKDLEELLKAVDQPKTRYKRYLPSTFFCSIVFFELREKNHFDKKALESITDGNGLRGFDGGIILRGDTLTPLETGKLKIMSSKSPLENEIIKPDRSLVSTNSVFSKTKKNNKDLYLFGKLMWFQHYFAEFAFDMVSKLNGTYGKGISSFHGLGQSNEE